MFTTKMLLTNLLLLSSTLGLATAADNSSNPFHLVTPDLNTDIEVPPNDPLSLISSTTTDTATSTSTLPSSFPTLNPSTNTTGTNTSTDATPTLSMSLPPGITSIPTANADPNATPTPRPLTDKATAYIIRHMHDRVLRDYELYSTAYCFHRGNTLRCGGPWLYGNSWNNVSVSRRLYKDTSLDPKYQCSSDKTYLGAPGSDRVFYGFGADNVTDALSQTARLTSVFAAGSCLMNSTCSSLYNNDTDQMYADYRGYINSTMLAYLKDTLSTKNAGYAYCPDSIQSTASMFSWLTDHFEGGREYFGFHNPMFLPGVLERLNSEEQLERIRAQNYFLNNAKKVEAVFLNMVFFTYDKSAGRLRHRADSAGDLVEIYPGCTRREFIAKGHCDGVVPPRTFDMDGSVISMADRDREEAFQDLSHPLANTGLAPRDDGTCSKIGSLKNQLAAIEAATALYNAVSIGIAAINVADSFVVATAVGFEAAPLIAALGIVYFAGALVLDVCDSFKTCNGVPDVPAALVKSFTALIAGGKLGTSTFKPFPLVKSMKPLAGFSGAFGVTATFAILKVAQAYYGKAEKCCEENCGGAVCQQTGLGCVLSYSSGATLDCNAE